MTAFDRSDHALRRMLLAAMLLFAQLLAPTVALGMLQAPVVGPVTVCRADGTVETMPDPGLHHGCAVCPTSHAPAPLLAGSPWLPTPTLHEDQAAPPAPTPALLRPLRIDARPRGPPLSA